jgi:hypothetical protein
MNIKFITFGSHQQYVDAAKRLINQAKSLNIFTECILYTAEDLMKNTDFWYQHYEFIKKNKRGYGYWLWKSYIIQKTMQNMNEGDILLYLDCGCELSSNRLEQLTQCFEIVKRDKLMYTLTCTERDWNKMDLLVKLDMNKDIYLNVPQRQAGAILFLVCKETIQLVNEWYTLACDYHNIDDSPSIIPNFPSFREHRHDQSIFSLLTKKYDLYSTQNLGNGIYYIRNKTAHSII